MKKTLRRMNMKQAIKKKIGQGLDMFSRMCITSVLFLFMLLSYVFLYEHTTLNYPDFSIELIWISFMFIAAARIAIIGYPHVVQHRCSWTDNSLRKKRGSMVAETAYKLSAGDTKGPDKNE